MTLKIRRSKISKKAKYQLNYFQHDRYLSRAHTLVGFSTGLVISLVFFFLSDDIDTLGLGSRKWYIFSVLLSALLAISFAVYAYWKSERVKSIEKIIEFIDTNLT